MAFFSRVFSGKTSSGGGFFGCFTWCFRSEPKHEEFQNSGSTAEPNEKDGLTQSQKSIVQSYTNEKEGSIRSFRSSHVASSVHPTPKGSTRSIDRISASEYTRDPDNVSLDYPDHADEPPPRSNGTAFAYDEETSSDSDDEVLRRYQQSISGQQPQAAPLQHAPSKQSLRSNRSQKSTASKASKASKHSKPSSKSSRGLEQEHLISLAEKGGYSESGSEDPRQFSQSHGTRSVVSSRYGSSYEQSGATSLPPGDTTEGSSLMASHGGAASSTGEAFENEGFQEDAHVSPDQPSQTSSDRYAETASMSVGDVEQDEHLFDVSDLQDREPAIISKCGNVEITFSYDAEKGKMNITVHQAKDIPSKDRGGANNSQVRLLLLPTKKVRHKTKIKPGDNPVFDETFSFKVPLEEVNNMGVRLRLYGCERMRRERMIGESVVGFASLNLDTETTHMLTLEPRSNLSHGEEMDVSSLTRSDSASSTQSMQHGGMPELLIGLAYNGTTGRLSVEVIKGSNFRNMAMNRAPDTYVKLTLMSPNGQEIARSKTSIRRGQPNPLYKETFMFQVALFQLPDVTLMVSVYNKRSMKCKEMIGWFSLGLNNSGEEELAHWNDMRESKGEQVCRWHVLLES